MCVSGRLCVWVASLAFRHTYISLSACICWNECSRWLLLSVPEQASVNTDTHTHTHTLVSLVCLFHFIVSQFAIQGHGCDSQQQQQLLCENFPCVNWDCNETRQHNFIFPARIWFPIAYWISVRIGYFMTLIANWVSIILSCFCLD